MRPKEVIKDENLLSILAEIKMKGRETFGNQLQEIFLYGSYAKNEQTPGSDLDIMFLFDREKKEIKKYQDEIVNMMVDLSLEHDILVSITENSVKDFHKYREFIPFYANVYNDGIRL